MTAATSPVDLLLGRLDHPKRHGKEWSARCPAHDDRTASLSITEGDDGRALLHCHAGCQFADIVKAFDLKPADLYPPKANGTRPEIVATYPYDDADGELLYEVVRFSPKDFRQRRPDGHGGWIWKLANTRRVLYRLPELLASIANDSTIFIVEGERDVDTLRRLGHAATCNPGGAGKWRDTYSKTLHGAEVVVVADADTPGRKHAQEVAASLQGIARTVTIAEPADGCKDITEHVSKGHSIEELEVIDTDPAASQVSDVSAPKATVPLDVILDEIDAFLGRYVAFPSPEARWAVAAWVVHCHALEAFESTPRLALVSPEKQCGKTRALEVIDLLTPNPLRTVNLSAAALFRKVSEGSCTLLLDEADTYLSPKVATQHEDLRGLVNAGHRRGAVAYRCVVEKGVKVEAFPAFAPVAIAAIGDLPDTILDRAVIIAMKRRRNDEAVEPFRARRAIPIGAAIRDQAAAWAATNTATLATFEPDMPEGITDRPADVWEALVMIGDSAGDEWSTRIRQAATLIEGERSDADVSLGVRLLVDIRTAFDGTPDTDRLSTVDLLQKLNEMDGAPWGDLRGKPLDARGLAWRLRRYKVKSSQLGGLNVKGYLRSDFHDAWARYLPSPMDPKQAKQEEHDGDLGAGQ